MGGGRFRLMSLLIFIGIMQAAATISSSFLAKTVFDRILNAQIATTNDELIVFGACLMGIAVIIGCLSMAERVAAEKIGQSYAETVRITLYDRLTTLPQRALQNRSHGGVLLRFVGDLTAVRQWVSLGLARLVVIGLTAFGSLIALAFINWTLAATVGVVLLLGTGISMGHGGEMRAATRESRRRMSKIAANINEKVGAISVLQVFGQVERERGRMKRQSRQLREAMVAKARVGGKIKGLAEGFAAFAYGSALVVGAMEVNLSQASPGTVIAALTVISLLVPKLRELGRVQEYWHGFNVSRLKMTEFLSIPNPITDLPNAPHLQPGLAQVEFKGVNSGVLQEITATAKPGSTVAIVGTNGAGKTSLLALAARLLDPDNGEVLIDGQNIRHYSLSSLSKLIGAAGPDFPLLRGSLERNLRYRCPQASKTERERVYQLCGIDEILASFPQRQQTKIAEGGAGLSAGQRQRIALARALLGNPPILLLDEADTNLDAQAITVIDKVLEAHSGTVLLVTHRRERIAKADMVWFMDNGRILEMGTPDQVFSGSGPTAKFFAPRLAVTNNPQQKAAAG